MTSVKPSKSSKRQSLRRDAATAAIAAYLLDQGLADTGLRRLAAECKTSDRMLLYYFDDKNDILTTVLTHIAADFANRLAELAPEEKKLPPLELLTVSAAFSQNPEMQPYFRLFVEVIAESAKKIPPFPAIAESMFEGYLDWTSKRLPLSDPEEKRSTALALIAIIDGLAVVNIGMGKEAATDAVATLSKLGFPDADRE